MPQNEERKPATLLAKNPRKLFSNLPSKVLSGPEQVHHSQYYLVTTARTSNYSESRFTFTTQRSYSHELVIQRPTVLDLK